MPERLPPLVTTICYGTYLTVYSGLCELVDVGYQFLQAFVPTAFFLPFGFAVLRSPVYCATPHYYAPALPRAFPLFGRCCASLARFLPFINSSFTLYLYPLPGYSYTPTTRSTLERTVVRISPFSPPLPHYHTTFQLIIPLCTTYPRRSFYLVIGSWLVRRYATF